MHLENSILAVIQLSKNSLLCRYAAWDFIEDSLTREKSELYAELWITYPALKKTLDERVEAAIARDEFTWDDVNVALKLVPDATPFFEVDDDEIIQIINEEM